MPSMQEQVRMFCQDNGFGLSIELTFEQMKHSDLKSYFLKLSNALSDNELKNRSTPINIYGDSDETRTLIGQAIGNSIRDLSGKSVAYVDSDFFIKTLSQIIIAGEADRFTDFFNRYDVLLIDRIHLLADKTISQEMLFNIMKQYYLNDKLLITTSATSPYQLKGIAERILVRLKGGILKNIETLY